MTGVSPAEEADKQKRLRYFRQHRKKELSEVQDPDVIDTFPLIRISPILDGRCCAYCKGKSGKYILTRKCKLEMLPPFSQCQNEEDGCRCTFIAISEFDA